MARLLPLAPILLTACCAAQEPATIQASEVPEQGRKAIALVEAAMKSPEGAPFPDENAWPILLDAIARWESSIPADSSEDDPVPLDLKILFSPKAQQEWTAAEKNLEAMRTKALATLAAADKNRVFATLTEFAKHKRVVRPAQEGELIGWLYPELSQTRALHRACMARLTIAAEAADWTTVVDSFESSLALGRAQTYQPALISYLVGAAGRIDAATRLRAELVERRFPADTLHSLDEALKRQSDVAPLSHSFETERCFGLDIIRIVYDDKTKTPHQVLAELADSALDATQVEAAASLRPLSSRAESLSLMNEMYDKLVALSRLPTRQALKAAAEFDSWADKEIPRQQAVVGIAIPAANRALEAAIHAELDTAGLRLMLAIHRFHADRGEYPDSLNALLPAYIDSLPQDPFGFGTFKYTRRPDNRAGYALYSVGHDGEDNDGRFNADDYRIATRSRGIGTDYVLNLPRQHH